MPLLDTSPTAMNLTFSLDNETQGNFIHQGSDGASGYLPGVNVFSKTNLSDSTHLLRVNVGPGSVFLFDYLIYTQITQDATDSSVSNPLAQDIPNPSESASP